MASINGIEAVELIASADPALALAVRQRGRWPVFERTADQPFFVNGIEGVIFGTTVTRLDSADPALALAERQKGKRVLVVVDSSGSVVPASNLSAPVLTWTSDETDATPEFTIDFDETAVEGAVITLQYSTSDTFSSPTEITDTLDAGEITASEIAAVTPELADGTYYFRAKVEFDGAISGWSNTEEVTINVASNAVLRTDGTYIFRTDGSKILRAT